MSRHRLDAYIVPGTDPHQSEYLPDHWQRRAWLSGFDGSAGDLAVTAQHAALWTDGRYFIQAERQLAETSIQLMRSGLPNTPTLATWLAGQLSERQRVGIDPRVLSPALYGYLEAACGPRGIKLCLVEQNLIDAIWQGRPRPPAGQVFNYPTALAGESASAKLRRVRRCMREASADAHVLIALDAIAWLYNVRADDVPHIPVAIANSIVTHEIATLFVDLQKLGNRQRRALQRVVKLRPYEDFGPALKSLAQRRPRQRVWLDDTALNIWVRQQLAGCTLLERPSPIWRMKAAKNSVELEGSRRAHRRDGIALVRFLHWLQEALDDGEPVTELGADSRLREFRAMGEHYRGDSFPAIVGYGAHGAIVHYRADESSDARIRRKGLLLIDSGAQYLDGTTDVTRTVLVGRRASREQRMQFTLVLKGHIALAMARFPAGTKGRQLDALARTSLWQAGLDYRHGTGHGVGHFLSVHEGPQSFTPNRCSGVPLERGNILSDEPGYYAEGSHGIRIENLLLVRRDPQISREGAEYYCFETLTLCPIDRALIEQKLLEPREQRWIDAYHRHVYRVLAPELDVEARAWLRRATRSLARA